MCVICVRGGHSGVNRPWAHSAPFARLCSRAAASVRESPRTLVCARDVGFRVQVTPMAPVAQCHACGCNWRQPASEDEELPKCPRCDGEFVERMSIGVAARAPRPNISAEVCTFSTVASIVASYSKSTRALTLENVSGPSAGNSSSDDVGRSRRETTTG